MILGQYPFLADTLQDTYDKIVNNPLIIPDGLNPLLRDLIEGLLCKGVIYFVPFGVVKLYEA
jgi:[calcium/calmodulin-dependent protein kinase] kinase